MGFSTIWEDKYKSNLELSIWPWDEVIALTHRHCNIKKELIVLELGCGAGANIPFFQSIKANYYAIEGSQTIVKRLQNSFNDSKINITCGDFTKDFEFDEIIGKVDLIIDRGSLTINTTSGIKNTIELIKSYLKPGGKFIGLDWYDIDCDYYKDSTKIMVDNHTYKFDSGDFSGYGNVYFSDENHIKELFSDFKIDYLINNIKNQLLPTPLRRSSFTFVAVKI
ncbi:SAM-dependent methyltransferase [Campylobacter vicugnae]|uniref:SAM-dependent methyltransferase n=2 Tax=Campylobacter vicugnae TaxID=1660076 RepID=A0A1X9SZR0_9BACT|nr:class I SAM-dependent methyltransferase [Campylobacter sp. RM8964]ARR01713.1 SAM-dependent methyltransferase [Campylobacter sp. RM8964]